ncbi:basic leucine zipper 19-like [Raphanus sativus]|uniref:Basic leucine zipper 19-like n=1 Tax=Raphanus sativus TaxID=3726 RepID=A0A9W3D7D7_RAPSA|nr:basic leucine zipper 19-like [Raphanus sativus]
MEEGELELSNNQEVFSSSDVGGGLPPSNSSIDSFFDGLLMDSQHHQQGACTHTHTCNNPTEHTHTHTCFHVHTNILPDDSDEKMSTDDTAESCGKNGEKRPLGNREAVRKYREKKKAKAASLEDECSRLRAVNQQLVKRLGNQGALEAEVSRLKCLLVDLRGRIDGEIGSFPYQKPSISIPSFSHLMNPCNVQCGGGDDDEVYCLQDGYEPLSGCDFDQLQCMAANQNLNGSFNSAANVSTTSNKRKGGNRAPKAG